MRVLLTGGAGFIGSHFLDRLMDEGHEVTVVDNFDPFYAESVKRANIARHAAHERFHLVEADIRDAASIAKIDQNIDAIVHLAAKAGVRPSIEDPTGYQATNVQGTLNLLEYARDRGIRQFVFASSSSVYGVNPRVPWREDDPVLLPISPYASTKVSAELMGHVYSKLYGIRFIALRFFTVYGPRQRPDLAIHKFAHLIREGRPIPFFGDGETRRDYTYVDDVVTGVMAAIGYEASEFEVINLGNNRTVSLQEMVDTLEAALGRKAVLERLPMQPGDVPQTWADLGKAERLLGYRPTTGFREGVERFAAWLEKESVPAPSAGRLRTSQS
jgi:UDP-glucuronate 4-epimerase